ncbi:MAG: immunity 53 family protein [Bacteroidota bacterium]
MNNIVWLSKWYKENCNGDWEHDYGILIETLDNPGWSIRVDLTDTDIRIKDKSWSLYEEKENDWYGYKIEDGKFEASGDEMKLDFLIGIFRKIVLEYKDSFQQ